MNTGTISCDSGYGRMREALENTQRHTKDAYSVALELHTAINDARGAHTKPKAQPQNSKWSKYLMSGMQLRLK